MAYLAESFCLTARGSKASKHEGRNGERLFTAKKSRSGLFTQFLMGAGVFISTQQGCSIRAKTLTFDIARMESVLLSNFFILLNWQTERKYQLDKQCSLRTYSLGP